MMVNAIANITALDNGFRFMSFCNYMNIPRIIIDVDISVLVNSYVCLVLTLNKGL